MSLIERITVSDSTNTYEINDANALQSSTLTKINVQASEEGITLTFGNEETNYATPIVTFNDSLISVDNGVIKAKGFQANGIDVVTTAALDEKIVSLKVDPLKMSESAEIAYYDDNLNDSYVKVFTYIESAEGLSLQSLSLNQKNSAEEINYAATFTGLDKIVSAYFDWSLGMLYVEKSMDDENIEVNYNPVKECKCEEGRISIKKLPGVNTFTNGANYKVSVGWDYSHQAYQQAAELNTNLTEIIGTLETRIETLEGLINNYEKQISELVKTQWQANYPTIYYGTAIPEGINPKNGDLFIYTTDYPSKSPEEPSTDNSSEQPENQGTTN